MARTNTHTNGIFEPTIFGFPLLLRAVNVCCRTNAPWPDAAAEVLAPRGPEVAAPGGRELEDDRGFPRPDRAARSFATADRSNGGSLPRTHEAREAAAAAAAAAAATVAVAAEVGQQFLVWSLLLLLLLLLGCASMWVWSQGQGDAKSSEKIAYSCQVRFTLNVRSYLIISGGGEGEGAESGGRTELQILKGLKALYLPCRLLLVSLFGGPLCLSCVLCLPFFFTFSPVFRLTFLLHEGAA